MPVPLEPSSPAPYDPHCLALTSVEVELKKAIFLITRDRMDTMGTKDVKSTEFGRERREDGRGGREDGSIPLGLVKPFGCAS
jgi:hypothetical protein